MKHLLAKAIMVMTLILTPIIAQAVPITVGAGWSAFSWSVATHGDIEKPYLLNPTFDFSSPVSTNLFVTDDGNKGEQFKVFNGQFGIVQIGTTSLVPTVASSGIGPDAAFLDPTYSSGQFLLTPGNYKIFFRVWVNPYTEGTGYLKVENAVEIIPEPTPGHHMPEPSTIVLLGTGLVGLIGYRMKKAKA